MLPINMISIIPNISNPKETDIIPFNNLFKEKENCLDTKEGLMNAFSQIPHQLLDLLNDVEGLLVKTFIN